MNVGRSDASTSTEDALQMRLCPQGRPLCLFYFTHPFGVLSPEPPVLSAAPPHVTRTFLNMRPVSPYWSSSSQDYRSEPSSHPSPGPTCRGALHLRDSVSSLFSSELWFSSDGRERRVVPYNKLPPLQLPVPRGSPARPRGSPARPRGSPAWPRAERFCLPPIDLSLGAAGECGGQGGSGGGSGGGRVRRRPRLNSVRRMMTGLMRRTVKGRVRRCRQLSPALREALQLLKEAWPEPSALAERWRAASVLCDSGDTDTGGDTGGDMWRGGEGAASPGLLRRRYSVPETIMRKYRLAQQRSEIDEGGQSSSASLCVSARGECTCCSPRGSGRDPMRKSALLRLWGRGNPARCPRCPRCSPATRSLEGSHSELRASPRSLTPKRLRMDTSRDRETESKFMSQATSLSYYSDRPPELTSSVSSDKSPPNSERTAFLSDDIYGCRTKIPANSTDAVSEDFSFTESSETFSKSMPTIKETECHASKYCALLSTTGHIDGRISESSKNAENEECNVLPYDQPLTIETHNYDILEIVVSETLNVQSTPALKNEASEKEPSPIKTSKINSRKPQSIDIDEYVSNILVESLNSLSDQLESMNASMGYDKKLNIVEKEIKVKLQNTGVNTIVHLSPTSNNQIIFGNEELYHSDKRQGGENPGRHSSSANIRECALSTETNNNLTSAESVEDNNRSQQPQTENILNITNNDNINKSILHQIQKLFKEEFQRNQQTESKPSVNDVAGISHLEISNVDVYLNDNADVYTKADTIEIQTQDNQNDLEVLGGIGNGNYFEEVEENTLVPRFSALPNSDSMEVNTSSSDDAEMLGSECASLVDSLDDPNSPRSVLLRRTYSNNKRSELVRSSIDVLDLLPENECQDNNNSPKERGESFFIRIKDNDCDCEKENIIVADHMPDTIKQRLYRRHRKREQRMECVRRSKVKQMKKEEIKNRRNESYKAKKEMERECVAIINTLIDDVIAKIAQEEYKCMRIKQRSNKIQAAKSEENLSRTSWKRNNEPTSKLNRSKMIHSYSCSDYTTTHKQRPKRETPSVQTHSPITSDEQRPKRIYQKSEIHDGNNCIEILEILEYVNSSQSSSETTHSDENHNNFLLKNKKSRIPVPVYERLPKVNSQKIYRNGCGRVPSSLSRERNEKTKHLLANMLLDAFTEDRDPIQDIPIRCAPLPYEPRVRSNSLRFQNSFDIIPEEKSNISMESTGEDIAGRRGSAPSLCNNLPIDLDEKSKLNERQQNSKLTTRYLKSTGTSPMPESYRSQEQVTAATSPIRKSAATSPGRPEPAVRVGAARREPAGLERRKSVTSHYGESVINTQSYPEAKREQKLKSHNCLNDKALNEFVKEGRRKSERDKERDVVLAGQRKGEAESVGSREDSSSSSSESGGSLLCSLAPAWLGARRRRRRAAHAGEWAVTVAGSCAAALPNDVEMRLRFPDPRAPVSPANPRRAATPPPALVTHCDNACAVGCGRARRGSEDRARRGCEDPARLTLTVKKEASDSSVLASKSVKKSRDLLPDLQETFRASRTNTRSSLKTRRGCSPHCWLPDGDLANIRARSGLSVSGSAIVPEPKPRVPTMSERDLTRARTPRRRFSYLRT